MYKQVIIVRNDLKLPKGKLAAQCAHASVEGVLKADKDVVSSWRRSGMMKIVVKVESESDLYKYAQLAKDKRLPVSIITDAGKTVVAPGTTTCCGVGPASEDELDAITGDLKLL
ncbi:MAG: peptidyl-tRNA hydrolase Pth2 [Nanoarchaeota archaeon]|nr:peptidyl-tRNA hydrolase Pth2 [Nanoarchaeota archaeon]